MEPRLLALFGSDRSRYQSATEVATFSGIAPVNAPVEAIKRHQGIGLWKAPRQPEHGHPKTRPARFPAETFGFKLRYVVDVLGSRLELLRDPYGLIFGPRRASVNRGRAGQDEAFNSFANGGVKQKFRALDVRAPELGFRPAMNMGSMEPGDMDDDIHSAHQAGHDLWLRDISDIGRPFAWNDIQPDDPSFPGHAF